MDGRQSRRPAFARRLRVHARQLLLKGSNVPRSLQSLERLAFRKRASQQPFHHQQRITHELTQLGEVGDAAQPALVEPRGAGIAVGVVDEARAERALLDFDHRRMRYVPQAARLEHVLLRVALVDAATRRTAARRLRRAARVGTDRGTAAPSCRTRRANSLFRRSSSCQRPSSCIPPCSTSSLRTPLPRPVLTKSMIMGTMGRKTDMIYDEGALYCRQPGCKEKVRWANGRRREARGRNGGGTTA